MFGVECRRAIGRSVYQGLDHFRVQREDSVDRNGPIMVDDFVADYRVEIGSWVINSCP